MSKKNIPLQRWWDFPAALVLVAALLISGTRLVATGWTNHLSIVQTLVFFGTIAGLTLGYSRFNARTSAFIAAIYGLFIIPWQLGKTLPEGTPWPEKMVILINRLRIIFSQLTNQERVMDSLLFLIMMFFLYWAISTYAGYAITRRGDAWLAILPGGLVMFVIHNFDSANAYRLWYLAAYCFLGLILVARMNFSQRQTLWKKSHTALPPHISLDFIRYTILATFIIIIFAWTIPVLAETLPQANRLLRPVRSAWAERTKGFENAFASLRGSLFTYTAVYGPTSSLGRGSLLSDTQIFTAKAPLDLPIGSRIYWRARAYDIYEGGQWRSSLDDTDAFEPSGKELPVETGYGRWTGSFSLTSAANITTLITPAQPLWVSRAGQVEFEKNNDGTLDITSISASPPVSPGESYHVLSSISSPTIRQLSESGMNYPEWILERYLQLPGTITPRTRELAEQITAGLETPYEKVVAVTSYLRTNIEYVEVLEELPITKQDPVDWFLFDAKKGFCNYYSSAEIVLLRSLGIPARYALGYAQGEMLDDTQTNFIPEDFTFIVRQRDAHAWPEVYFEGIGWVEFEPTVSQPEIERLESSEDDAFGIIPENDERDAMRESERGQRDLLRDQADQDAMSRALVISPLNLALSLLAIISLVMITIWALPIFGLPPAPMILQMALINAGIRVPKQIERWAERQVFPKKTTPLPVLIEKAIIRLGLKPPKFLHRWARHAELPTLSKAYMEINRALNLLGHSPTLNDTPAERAANLTHLLPPAKDPAFELVSQYQNGTFGDKVVDLQSAQKSAGSIRNLAIKGYLKRLLQRFQKPDYSQKLRRLSSE